MPARPVAPHLARGARGEDAAAAYLENLGYTITARNWRAGSLEIDIVAQDGDTLVFAEVKTRKAGSLAAPHEALTPEKARRLAKAASLYLTSRQAWDRPCRFDFLGVTPPEGRGQPFSVEHVENVIQLGDLVGGGHAAWQPW